MREGGALDARAEQVGRLSPPQPLLRASKSIERNIGWTLFGNAIYAACQWGQLVILSRFLTKSDVGLFAFSLALTAPLMLFASLGLRTIQVTAAGTTDTVGTYMSVRVVTSIATIIVTVALTMAVGYSGFDQAVVLIVLLAKIADGLSDVVHGALQKRHEMDLIAKATVLNGVLSLILMALLVSITGSVLWGAVGSLCGSVFAFFTFSVPQAQKVLGRNAVADDGVADFWPKWNRPEMVHLARLGAPLGVAYLLSSLSPNVPRYAIERFLGSDELGVFAAIASLTAVGPIVMGALYQVMLPQASELYSARNRATLARMLTRLVGFAVLIGVIAVALASTLGHHVIPIVFSETYSTDEPILTLLTIAMAVGFVIWMLDLALASARRFSVQVPLNLVTIVTTLAGALLLTPRFGLTGAAVALCIGAGLQCILKALIVIKVIVAIPELTEAKAS